MVSWTWQTIAWLWIVSLAASLGLMVLQFLLFYRRAVAENRKFFWLLPYPGNAAGLIALARALARHAPLAAVALYVVPAAALVLTLSWLVVTSV